VEWLCLIIVNVTFNVADAILAVAVLGYQTTEPATAVTGDTIPG
jgi:hypothetical protein